MDSIDPGNFVDYTNSFFAAAFLQDERPDLEMPEPDLLSNLSSISALYLYSNPPPMGYGTPAPKVAETVLRAYDMNKNPEGKTELEIDGYKIEDPVWHGGPEDFPWLEPASNFCPSFVNHATEMFMIKDSYLVDFIEVVRSVIDDCMSRNSDVLTKGRQTYCPLTESSVPCAQAYKNMMDLFKANGAPATMSILGLIQHFFKLLQKNSLRYPQVVVTCDPRKLRIRGRVVEAGVNRRKTKWTRRAVGDEKYHTFLGFARSFCTYLKNAERSHLQRRAIASPNIIKRAFLYVIEEVHLRFSKKIEGSTISFGGEEKKNKISETVESLFCHGKHTLRMQGTEDATKWNETLSAALFGMVHKTMLDDPTRVKFGLPKMTEQERIYLRLCMASHFILAIKRVTLGPGLQGRTDDFHGEIPYDTNGLSMVNSKTRDWFSRILPLREGNNYIRASPGMLMGMHNALSTVVGLVPVNALHSTSIMMKVLRSSDDSMSVHVGNSLKDLLESADQQYMELKLSAIALSPKKTALYMGRFGEYTSWFQDDVLVAQYGPETTTLRPAGRNPYDDAHAMAKGVAVSLLNCSSNIFGAEVKLALGLSNVQSLYRIKPVPEGDPLGPMVRVMANGGASPWDISNCHLDESVIKEMRYGANHPEYYLKIRNPTNPFSRHVEEQTYFDRELGILTTDFIEVPATVFSYVKRGNRSRSTKQAEDQDKTEEAAQALLDVIHTLDMSTALRTPLEATPLSDFCYTKLMLMKGDLELDPDEERLYRAALARLRPSAQAIDDGLEDVDADCHELDGDFGEV
nr:PB1 [Wuhan Mosquito Virus 6]